MGIGQDQRDERIDPFLLVGRFSKRLSLTLTALAMACCIGMLGALGALQLNGKLHGNGMYRLFALDAEWTGPAILSCLLLLQASVTALSLARFTPETRLPLIPTVMLGLLLAFMALDELASFHEQLERWTAIDWQLLYLPAGASAAALWLITLRGFFRFGTGGVPFLCGGLVWLMSQVFEFVQWSGFDSGRVVHSWAVVPEEVLEMSGSALFALGLLAALKAAALLRFASPPGGVRAGRDRTRTAS